MLAGCIGLFEQQSFFSALIGGFLFVLPNTYFTVLAFRYCGADKVRLIAKSFSRGQSGKIILVMAGFIMVFSTSESLNMTALFSEYIVMLLLHVPIAKVVSDRCSK